MSVNADKLEETVLISERIYGFSPESLPKLGTAQLNDEKRNLNERYILGELSADDYKVAKIEIDAEKARSECTCDTTPRVGR